MILTCWNKEFLDLANQEGKSKDDKLRIESASINTTKKVSKYVKQVTVKHLRTYHFPTVTKHPIFDQWALNFPDFQAMEGTRVFCICTSNQ